MNEPERHCLTAFGEALECSSPQERAAYLDRACGQDNALRARVEELLRAHEAAGGFLQGNPPANFPESLAPDGVSTVPEAVRERPGAVLGPYKLLEQIGEGGFGIVFLAEQQQPLRRKVALKVLKPGMDTRQVVARFEAERQALALMDHPNIAHVFDGGETATGRPFFVMELVKGVRITDFCDQNQLNVRQRLELFVSVCQAVQHAHQKGIIHRDLKPSNVLVTVHDGTPVVKVIDFGIAKAVGQQLTEKTLFTAFAQMVGTPLYMSPEQAGMSGLDVDTRSDIYSLGVLLYELLTGTTPFNKERLRNIGYEELRRIICEEEPPRPSTRLSTLAQAATTASGQRKSDPKRLSQMLRGELDWIVMRALEKDRNRRYESASAFAADVQRYLHDEPVLACPPSAWYRFKKFARRNRVALAMAAVILTAALTLAGGVGWTLQERAGRRETTRTGIAQALQAATTFLKEGKLAEASAAIRKAEGFLAGGGEAEPDLAQGISQARKDLDTLSLLQEARLRRARFRDGAFDRFDAEPSFAAAFKQYGLDLAVLTPEAAAACIKESAIRDNLVAGLDEWAFVVKSDKQRRDRLLAIARLADDDSWRRQFRDLGGRKDRKELLRLAEQPEVPKQPPASIVLLGEVLFTVGAEKEAVELLRQGQRLHPGDFWMNHMLAIQLAVMKKRGPGNAAEAVGFLRVALAIRPHSPGVHNNLAAALQRAGQLAEADVHYRLAIKLAKALGEDYVEARRNLGLLQHRRGNYQAALALFDRVLQSWPTYPVAHCNRGDALEALNRLEEAAKAFHKAIQLQEEMPKNRRSPETDIRADAHLGLGIVRVKQKKWQEALVRLREAQRFDAVFVGKGYRAYPEIPFNLGLALENLGRRDEAIRAYRESLRLNPLSPAALVNLGNIYRAMKSKDGYARAEELYRKAIDVQRDCAKAWTNLGAVLNATGRHTEAVKCLEEAVKHDPKDATTYYNMGIALVGSGRLAEAEKAYRKVLELDDKYAEAHCNLGGVLRRQGRFKEALTSYRRGHELGRKTPGWSYPSERWLKDAARLAELDGMFAAVLRGEPPPTKPNDFFGVTEFAIGWKKLPATAAHLYAQGLEKLPLTGEFKAVQFYNGACAACLAATGKGRDALDLDEKERARLRGQALQWLRAALAVEKERGEKANAAQRAATLKRVQHWLVDADLAVLRDPVSLANLPADERGGCLRFWADVLAFQAQLRPSP